MTYKGFKIRITSAKVSRQDKNGQSIECDGFIIEIFDSETDTPIDVFNAAVDYELLSNSFDEAEQLAKDYIDTEKRCSFNNKKSFFRLDELLNLNH